jgi:hypothetical protein
MPNAEAKSVRVTGGIAAIAADRSVGIFEKAGDLVGGEIGPPFVVPNHFRRAKFRHHTSPRPPDGTQNTHLSPPIRPLHLSSGPLMDIPLPRRLPSDAEGHGSIGKLINDYEAEEERIVNLLSRKLEQVGSFVALGGPKLTRVVSYSCKKKRYN